MQATKPHYYSPEEYLELEEAARFRSEYKSGQILPMTGGTPNHNRIAGNIYAALNFGLADQDYDVFVTDLRLWIPQVRLYTYPDVMVVAGEPELAEGRKDTITNPLLIVEVLSESTKNYDRGEKFEFYRSIASFQEYVLVDQYRIHVEHCLKTGDQKWLLSEFRDISTILSLASVSVKILLSEVYKKVKFD